MRRLEFIALGRYEGGENNIRAEYFKDTRVPGVVWGYELTNSYRKPIFAFAAPRAAVLLSFGFRELASTTSFYRNLSSEASPKPL